MFDKELHEAGVQIIAALPPIIISIMVALGLLIVALLHRITKRLDAQDVSREQRIGFLRDGQEAIIDAVKNGPANALARRVLTAEDSHTDLKGAALVNGNDNYGTSGKEDGGSEKGVSP